MQTSEVAPLRRYAGTIAVYPPYLYSVGNAGSRWEIQDETCSRLHLAYGSPLQSFA